MADRDISNSLSTKGKKLARKYVRFEIRGKLARGVPVLLDNEVRDCMNCLVAHRKVAVVPERKSYLFGLPSADTDRYRHLRACDLMREHSSKCGAEIPEVLRGTKLRKHIAIQCINLNLNDEQVTDLENFLGHAEKIHKEIYRQPVLQTDIIKISESLNTAQGIKASDEESDEGNDINCSIPRKSSNKKDDLKRNVSNETSTSYGPSNSSTLSSIKSTEQVWSAAEQEVVVSTFAKQLSTGKVPSGAELQQLIDQNDCLKNRTVPQLRTWIHTQKKKMTGQ